MTSPQLRIAVLVPCYNEEAAVATVVADFRKALPSAEIYVYDNNSRDRTAALAREAGAIVRSERRQGKGHVVRRMFADVEADVYVLVDGDATYDAPSAPRMIDDESMMVPCVLEAAGLSSNVCCVRMADFISRGAMNEVHA